MEPLCTRSLHPANIDNVQPLIITKLTGKYCQTYHTGSNVGQSGQKCCTRSLYHANIDNVRRLYRTNNNYIILQCPTINKNQNKGEILSNIPYGFKCWTVGSVMLYTLTLPRYNWQCPTINNNQINGEILSNVPYGLKCWPVGSEMLYTLTSPR